MNPVLYLTCLLAACAAGWAAVIGAGWLAWQAATALMGVLTS